MPKTYVKDCSVPKDNFSFLSLIITDSKRINYHELMNRYIKCSTIHTKEYYLAIKRNEILTHATTWMKLENIMLSERSKTQKAE